MADKLISADALLKRICELCGENCEMPNEAVTCIEWEFTHDAIESLPPVDAVEAVRCKDCEFASMPQWDGEEVYCTKHNNWFKINGYCHLGRRKRKEDETN